MMRHRQRVSWSCDLGVNEDSEVVDKASDGISELADDDEMSEDQSYCLSENVAVDTNVVGRSRKFLPTREF